MKNVDFTRNLLKGKIAEVVFEQMIRGEGKYTVIPFGYEHTVPSLAQYQNLVEIKKVMENIGDAPDFALISDDKTRVYLVEVKYRKVMEIDEVKECASKILKRWDPSWIFIATPQRFYCAPCSSVVNESRISELSESWVERKNQNEYLRLLNEFEKA